MRITEFTVGEILIMGIITWQLEEITKSRTVEEGEILAIKKGPELQEQTTSKRKTIEVEL